MGIDLAIFGQLLAHARRGASGPRGLMLGRHGLHLRRKDRRAARRALKAHGFDLTLDDVTAPDGYAERFLKAVGLGDFVSMDNSTFEGASIVHDLNLPVAPELHGRFDTILDAGTIEHVFNVPMAFQNVHDMLAPGGVFISANAFNNWPCHGFYQFNPELAWSHWGRACRYDVLTCVALPRDPEQATVALGDAGAEGGRIRPRALRRLPEGRLLLYYEVRKTAAARSGVIAQQGDYAAAWSRHETTGRAHAPAPV